MRKGISAKNILPRDVAAENEYLCVQNMKRIYVTHTTVDLHTRKAELEIKLKALNEVLDEREHAVSDT